MLVTLIIAPLALHATIQSVDQSAMIKNLDRAPKRKAAWLSILAKSPKSQKEAVRYILTYMPLADLRALPTKYVSDAVKVAYTARAATTWATQIPKPVFFDSVVPYASVTEPRESMRLEFQRKYLSLAQSAHSPGEAALAVNKTLFKEYKVVYDTHRLRTDQSAKETAAQGMATCTGLSIMLVEALRAVGVPSRLAGIPNWPKGGGNHTWVEVWDQGTWHFVGAAEPDDHGLDHAWFGEQAKTAIADKPENAIYAVTYKDGGARFPLAWLPGESTAAENVTNRYKADVVSKGPTLAVDVKVAGERVVSDVQICDVAVGNQCISGISTGPHDDINKHFAINAALGKVYKITVIYKGRTIIKNVTVNGDTVIRIDLDKK